MKNTVTLDSLVIPESRIDRFNKLNNAIDILKKEFIGIDDIIDQIKQRIIPWYITPEINERPTIISLFGLTGTGKTSVVRRLINLLGLTGNAIYFDCGLEANESSSSDISEKIYESIGIDSYDNVSSSISAEKRVFVFDEFQYARTISQTGEELLKSPLRPLWTLMDSGIVSANKYNYETNKLINFINDISDFSKNYPEMKLNSGKTVSREDTREILLSLGGFWYCGRDISKLIGEGSAKRISCSKPLKIEDDDSLGDVLEPLGIVSEDILRIIFRKCNSFKEGSGLETIKSIISCESLQELSTILKDVEKIVNKPRELDCSDSLIFILGNIDEAFGVEGDISPDMDADTFYYQTVNVSINDIKESLKKRFRAEQIARLGNNLIVYPALTKDSFIKIIEKELSRIYDKFKNETGIILQSDDDITKVMYLEGVFPTQGVRPMFTTIGSLLSPLLSDIIINKPENTNLAKISLTNRSDLIEKELKLPETSLTIDFYNTNVSVNKIGSIDKIIKLQLGSLRCPTRRKTRYINSVHEAGHAIVALYETGVYPRNIISVSSGDGGFVNSYNPKKEGEIETRGDVDSEIKILLAGYSAEELVFDDPSRRLMGSGSDIYHAWNYFSRQVYDNGYFEPYYFSNYDTESNISIPGGLSDNYFKVNHPYNLKQKATVRDAIINRFEELRRDTKSILRQELSLLKHVSIYLGEHGSISVDKFKEFVEKYGNNLNSGFIKEKEKDLDESYYLNKLLEL